MSEHDGPRAAIIGAGLMGYWHGEAVGRLGGRVTVIVDPNEKARRALGRRHPHAELLADLDPRLVASRATAAHVCTPLATHAVVARMLLDAGVHVLVEKPFGENAATTEEVLALATQRGVIACPVHQFAFQEGMLRLVEWLPSLGTIRRLEFSTCSAGAPGTDPASLDSLVAEILPHPLALTTAVLGMAVASANWQVASPVAGEMFAVATFGEATVTIFISAHGRPTENVLRVVGDAGSATADLFHGFAVRHSGVVSRRAKVARPFVMAATTFAEASTNLVRRGLRGEQAYPGLRELVRRFHSAVSGRSSSPISAATIVDIARGRDHLLERMAARPLPQVASAASLAR